MGDLENEIKSVRRDLAQKEKDLQLAAEIGQQLLESNNEYSRQLESVTSENSVKLEKLEQEKYALQLRLDQKVSMERNYSEEIDSLKSALSQRDDRLSLLETEQHSRMSEVKNQVAALQSEIEQHELTQKQLTDKIQQLTEMLQEAQGQLEQQVCALNETSTEELGQLHVENNELKTEKVNLTREISEAKHRIEQLSLHVETMKAEITRKDEEIEEKMCQSTSYFNALEKSREETMELRVEIDLIKMETQDQKKKGNSLFGELEDRRVDAEKRLISMKVEYESMKKQSTLTKQHLHKLKVQMAGLLQMHGGFADTSHIERLQQQLDQARSEVQSLSDRLQEKQKQQTDIAAYHAKTDASGQVDKHYSDFVQALIDTKEKEISGLQQELSAKRMLLLAESDKVIQCERNLYTTEQQLEKIRGQNMKLHLRVEELRMKYEPDAMRMKGKNVKTKIEILPVGPSKGENPDEEKENGSDESSHEGAAPSHNQSAFRTLTELHPRGKTAQSKPGTQASQSHLSCLTVKRDATDILEDDGPKSTKTKRVTLSDDVIVHSAPSEGEEETGEEEVFEKKNKPRGRLQEAEVVPVTGSDSDCKVQ